MPKGKRGDKPQKALKQRKAREQQLQRITTYTGIGALVVVLALLGAYFLQTRTPSVEGTAAEFKLDAQPVLGEPDAPVKVVEFADFKCPACKQFHELVFYKLKEDYIDTGKVQLVFMDFPIPLGDDSYTAAVAGECLYRQSNAAFWAYYNAMFKYQGDERETWVTLSRLLQIVRDYVEPLVEVDEAAFEQCVQENRYRSVVDEDKRQGLAAGVRGTPTIFINGKKVQRWYPYSGLKALIDKELERAAAEE